jgi:hypothetical protein
MAKEMAEETTKAAKVTASPQVLPVGSVGKST